MIGHVGTGKSFYYLLRYCLEDKKELTELAKLELAARDHLQHKERAEVLDCNLCIGNKNELVGQFTDVAKLSRRVEKPVLHIALRLAPDDVLTKAQLIDIGRECAAEFGVADHQYICVLHKDTSEQHIHIVANRVGFDGKVVSDSQSYKRMASLCREIEKKYGLASVLSPRKFLPKDQRKLPRRDSRKEKLKGDIRNVLEKTTTYPRFEQQMKALGYKVIKGRGISFIDDKKVKIKGSEVGFSLANIERILSLKIQLASYQVEGGLLKGPILPSPASGRTDDTSAQIQRELSSLLQRLLQPEHEINAADPELLRNIKRKKKRLSL